MVGWFAKRFCFDDRLLGGLQYLRMLPYVEARTKVQFKATKNPLTAGALYEETCTQFGLASTPHASAFCGSACCRLQAAFLFCGFDNTQKLTWLAAARSTTRAIGAAARARRPRTVPRATATFDFTGPGPWSSHSWCSTISTPLGPMLSRFHRINPSQS